IDWIGHTEYSETRIEQLDHIFNLIGMTLLVRLMLWGRGHQAALQHFIVPSELGTGSNLLGTR
ncbi:hypothetical protein, partial [Aeromonas caviae]|uniref:hypothetical protein n=1 Tax=Aeromonas caviae TaxID=648 RepID=UPI001FFD496D